MINVDVDVFDVEQETSADPTNDEKHSEVSTRAGTLLSISCLLGKIKHKILIILTDDDSKRLAVVTSLHTLNINVNV